MTDAYTYTPQPGENRNIFAASCIESVATALQQPAADVYQRMKRVNLIDEYLADAVA